MTGDESRIMTLALRNQFDIFSLAVGEEITARWSHQPTLEPALIGEYVITSHEMTFHITAGDDLVKFKRVA